jgi:hypothetical protein
LSARSTGKEEVRATLLKPYLLRLRDERGEAATRVLLSKVGIPQHVLEDETSWISLSAARRALHALQTALGDDAIASRGAWMTHPETLGAYVRMLRVASAPIDAYEYLIAHHAEATRAGTYKHAQKEKWRNGHRIRIVYTPHAELNSEQDDRILCEARRSELAGIPRLWGYPDAEVKNITCLADDHPCCTYSVSWSKPRSRRLVIGALSGAFLCGGAVAASGNALGAAIGAVTGATASRTATATAAAEPLRRRSVPAGAAMSSQAGASQLVVRFITWFVRFSETVARSRRYSPAKPKPSSRTAASRSGSRWRSASHRPHRSCSRKRRSSRSLSARVAGNDGTYYGEGRSWRSLVLCVLSSVPLIASVGLHPLLGF